MVTDLPRSESLTHYAGRLLRDARIISINQVLHHMTKLFLGLSALVRTYLWMGYALANRCEATHEVHARAAVKWLLGAAQGSGSGGFAHSLHFARGWLADYPETTGYIIPTLCLAAKRYGLADAERAGMVAWQWLCSLQQADGAFPDLAGKPQVFDTGQILIGANFLCRMGDAEAPKVARKCSDWLLRQQSTEGCFVVNAYNEQPHAYYSRVGAALLETGQMLNLAAVTEAGLRNLEWTLCQQKQDGWFEHMSFAEHPPYSHTIVYTLEGLLAGYHLCGDDRLRDAVVRCAIALRESIARHGGFIRSQYKDGFVAVDEQICVTGLCQWSALCFRLDRLGVSGFRDEAERSLAAAKRLQLCSPLRSLSGALPGSVPLSGRYMRYALPNWGVKFFLDALLEADGGDDLPPLI